MLLTGVGGAEAHPVRSITEIATAQDRLSERLGFRRQRREAKSIDPAMVPPTIPARSTNAP